MKSSRGEEDDILYWCWVMPITHCPLPRWRSAEELFSKSGAENRGDFRSQELTSVLCCAFWAQVNMEKTHNIWIHMETLWWWSVPLCTTARVQTRWLTIILLELWLPRRERRKLLYWRIAHIGFVEERKSGTIGSYFPNINEQCLSLH